MKTREQNFILVQTKIDAPPELVWKLWTNPEDIEKWNNASEDWHTTKADNDLRKGGKFSFRMEAKDGSEGFDFVGTYNEIIPFEKIDYTMNDGRRAKVSFTKSGGKTKIVETFEPEAQNPEDFQLDGWQSILNNFKRYAEIRSALSKPHKITHQITPCLWFNKNAEEAAAFYLSIFKNSRITGKTNYTKEGYDIHGMEEGTVMTIDFQINGQPFTLLNGSPAFKFSEAISLQISCDTQEEIDYYWEKLTINGGSEGQCGWLKDKFGVSWQIAPSILPKLLSDREKAERVIKALMPMKKLDIETLRKA
jgi:predicted 3-demethylubiquinone-9 3-methyltransferase (glyoxalase superfamily)/uncharacterized protein YndB with AHSA1/START domain